MRGSLVHIADLVLNRPLLVTPQKAAVISQVLSGRIGVDGLVLGAGVDAQSVEAALSSIGKPAPGASRFAGEMVRMEGQDRPAPYQMTRNGAAVITTTGSLVNRGAWVGASSGLTSYEGISYQLKTAANDSRVKAILLDLETPGGQAVGAFELGALVRKVASVKPVYAIVNGMAASAGYALASGATKIITTPSGVSGSIGVVLLHADMSKKLEKEGITPTLIFAGAHKVDGNSLEPLSSEVKAELQAEVDTIYDKFVRLVYENRGSKISLKAIRETEGRTYIGEDAVKAGLADSVGTFDDVLAALSAGRSVGRSSRMKSGTQMGAEVGAASDLDCFDIMATMGNPTKGILMAGEETKFKKGDRVRVKGKPHMKGQKSGTIEEVSDETPYAIKFAGSTMVHKWYVDSELELDDGKDDDSNDGNDSDKDSGDHGGMNMSNESNETAKSEGVAAGTKAANDRFASILADDRVKGKERIALDLAVKSPSMSADDVASFVAGIPAPVVASSVPPIAQRGADAALDEIETNASSGGNSPKADNDAASWGAVIDRVLPANR
ncbi:S49 family peptidase [Microvirga sp. Mcv34]|uniref:S49 family peptidase n=1 Tax=Microvirga sp. Mcv34 TaxID=2926016 RepID=UPI0021CA5C0C|nr:S49 family peptidase [Microvirga sp. Mcv34]